MLVSGEDSGLTGYRFPDNSGTTLEAQTALDIAIQSSRRPELAATFNFASQAHNNHFFFESLVHLLRPLLRPAISLTVTAPHTGPSRYCTSFRLLHRRPNPYFSKLQRPQNGTDYHSPLPLRLRHRLARPRQAAQAPHPRHLQRRNSLPWCPQPPTRYRHEHSLLISVKPVLWRIWE